MRTRLVGMLAVGLVLGLSGVAAAQPPTLSGEEFSGPGVTVTSLDCGIGPDGNVRIESTYRSTGTASGPYAGTYRETGGVAPDGTFSARFAIDSSAGRVIGKRTGPAGQTCRFGSCSGVKACEGEHGLLFASYGGSYQALIRTRGGAFADSGTHDLLAYDSDLGYHSGFTSGLGSPTPFSKNGCKNGGWRGYGFANQGDCVSFVG